MQIRLGTLLLLFIPIAILVFFVNRHYELGRRPIDWQPFTQELLDEELATGKTVIVFLRYDAMITDSHLDEVFASPEFRREFHTQPYSAMTTVMDDENAKSLLDQYSAFTNLMVFNPAAAARPHIFPAGGLYSREALIKKIKKPPKPLSKTSG